MDLADGAFRLACPECGQSLEPLSGDELGCPGSHRWQRRASVWQPSPAAGETAGPSTETGDQRFLRQYRTVRRSEGWGSEDPGYYRRLPRTADGDPHREVWRIRAKTYELLQAILQPLRSSARQALAADLGAGNGWLSHRLCRLGFRPLAIDLSVDERDGLGACRHYGPEATFPRFQGSFDRLPLESGQLDLVIWNGSFHYSRDYQATLEEGLRVLQPAGLLVILDSPTYRSQSSGRAMLEERRQDLLEQHGIADPEANEGFLTLRRLHRLGRELGVRWREHRPSLGWRWRLRPWKERLLGRRETASFPLFVGRPANSGNRGP